MKRNTQTADAAPSVAPSTSNSAPSQPASAPNRCATFTTVDEGKYHTGVFITQTPISPSAVRLLSGVPNQICEHFQEQDLLVNITRHELVPKHILLSQEEKNRLLERYRLKESSFRGFRCPILCRVPWFKERGCSENHSTSETAGRLC